MVGQPGEEVRREDGRIAGAIDGSIGSITMRRLARARARVCSPFQLVVAAAAAAVLAEAALNAQALWTWTGAGGAAPAASRFRLRPLASGQGCWGDGGAALPGPV